MLSADILLTKREAPFARIDRQGRTFVGDIPMGRLTAEGGGLSVRRNGRTVGRIRADGVVWATGAGLAGSSIRVDGAGGVHADGRQITEVAVRTARVSVNGGVWGYLEGGHSPTELRAVAAFLLFFTELPHVMQRLDQY